MILGGSARTPNSAPELLWTSCMTLASPWARLTSGPISNMRVPHICCTWPPVSHRFEGRLEESVKCQLMSCDYHHDPESVKHMNIYNKGAKSLGKNLRRGHIGTCPLAQRLPGV